MIRKAFVLQLNVGQRQEYAGRHNPIWPVLERMLRRHGAHINSIFLHPDTNQLFGYIEIADEVLWAASRNSPECRQRWAYMCDIMVYNSDGTPQAVGLEELFHLP